MSNRFLLHPGAYADLDEIRDYIAKDNPDAADRVIGEIFDAIDKSCAIPESRTSTP